MPNDCTNPVCKLMFEEIHEKLGKAEDRMNEKSRIIDEHGTAIEVVKNDTGHITKSIDGLTKALWAVALTTFGVLIKFFIDYIWTLQH